VKKGRKGLYYSTCYFFQQVQYNKEKSLCGRDGIDRSPVVHGGVGSCSPPLFTESWLLFYIPL
jgi:hypothetical protein